MDIFLHKMVESSVLKYKAVEYSRHQEGCIDLQVKRRITVIIFLIGLSR